MDVTEIQTFMAARGTKTPAQIAEFSARLMAAHDEIVTYPALLEMLEGDTKKEDRKVIYAALEAESRKYPFLAVKEDPLLGKPICALRAKMEAFRGVKRDRDGKLIFTAEERAKKIEDIKGKIAEVLGPDADLSQKYGPWIEDMKVEMKRHQDFIDGRLKHNGSIWDFINEKPGDQAPAQDAPATDAPATQEER